MNNKCFSLGNERGFVLVVAMVMLVILSLLGVFALNTTDLELQISGNEKVAKQTFYEADGGAELMERLTFENAVCFNSGGFTVFPSDGSTRDIGSIRVYDLNFSGPRDVPSIWPPASPDIRYFLDSFDQKPQTDLGAYGKVRYSTGSGLQMVSGYEGLGSGSAAGATNMLYTIYAKHSGVLDSESVISTEWQLSLHLINNASSYDCNYDD